MTADVPMRLLEALVAVADTGTFTAAAARVHVSQPALSQSIRRLEGVVGVRLVDRHPFGATLTPAGGSLADDARSLLVRLEGAIGRAARAGDGSTTPALIVGFGSTTPRRVTTAMLEIGDERIGASIRLEHVPWGQETARLTSGAVDLVLLATDGAPDPELELVEKPARQLRPRRSPVGHPLGERASIRLDELDREPVVDAGSDRSYWLALPRPSGAAPPIVAPAARTVEEMLAFVSAGRGMAITSASVAESASQSAIRFVVIEDLAPVKLSLARLRDDRRPRVLRFLEAMTAAR